MQMVATHIDEQIDKYYKYDPSLSSERNMAKKFRMQARLNEEIEAVVIKRLRAKERSNKKALKAFATRPHGCRDGHNKVDFIDASLKKHASYLSCNYEELLAKYRQQGAAKAEEQEEPLP